MHGEPFTHQLRSSLEQLLAFSLSTDPFPAQQRLVELLTAQAQAIDAVATDIQAQTVQLGQTLEYQAMLRRITDRVRDSLDETQILQTVVQELGSVLDLCGCDTAQYDQNLDATVLYRYAGAENQEQVIWHEISQAADLKALWFQEQATQFCYCKDRRIILVCPILDGQTLLGDLLLYRSDPGVFSELEVDLVQQVASQCAIAIRQARLYQTLQAQVKELERLNQVKDEFLDTVSYELRVPISNMKLATQMLHVALDREVQSDSTTYRYLQILQNECDREAGLIENLLDLQQLDTNKMSLLVSAVPLDDWLPRILDPLYAKFQERDLALTLEIQPHLPAPICDHINLSRVVTELLNNAHKFTPSKENVIVTATQGEGDWIAIVVINTGVEIPREELHRIFEKFYRLPKLDFRREGGTGLGLSLVQKLVARLGGTIQVSSKNLETRFTVLLPIAHGR
jgi:signal transduction histidine kinase